MARLRLKQDTESMLSRSIMGSFKADKIMADAKHKPINASLNSSLSEKNDRKGSTRLMNNSGNILDLERSSEGEKRKQVHQSSANNLIKRKSLAEDGILEVAEKYEQTPAGKK